MTSKLLTCVVLLAAVLLPACGESGGTVVGSGSSRFPADTLSDWKSYADHLVSFTVAAEEEVPLSPEEEQRGEGMTGRRIAIEIDEVHWSAPGAPTVPRQMTWTASGWVVNEDERQPFRLEDSPRKEVGQAFLAPIALMDHPAGEWWPLSSSAQLQLVDGLVAPRDGESHQPLKDLLAGRTPKAVADALEEAQADPLAVKYRDLRPEKRVRAVLEEREGSG